MVAAGPPGSAWFPYPGPAAAGDPAVTLFAVPCAGAGASQFLPWREHAPPWLRVLGVQLPGREGRLREAPLRCVEQVIGQLLPAVLAEARGSFALFGHSMGARVAFALARAAVAAGRGPCHLFVAGAGAPHLPPHRPLHGLPDAALLAELTALGGTPSPVLRDRELVDLLLPTLRADLELAEGWPLAAEPPLPVPITALAGDADLRAGARAMAAWREVAGAGFLLRELPGGHFLPRTAVAEVVGTVVSDLRGSVPPDRLPDRRWTSST